MNPIIILAWINDPTLNRIAAYATIIAALLAMLATSIRLVRWYYFSTPNFKQSFILYWLLVIAFLWLGVMLFFVYPAIFGDPFWMLGLRTLFLVATFAVLIGMDKLIEYLVWKVFPDWGSDEVKRHMLSPGTLTDSGRRNVAEDVLKGSRWCTYSPETIESARRVLKELGAKEVDPRIDHSKGT